MVTEQPLRIAILISGRGSNMEAILKRFCTIDSLVTPVVVISDQIDAKGIETARRYGVPSETIPREAFSDKAEHEERIAEAIERHSANLICLAGFMRVLSAAFVKRFSNRILNIHPSLLPAYKGLNTHQRVLDAGDQLHGCTVHLVSEELDGGAVIAQASVDVRPDDDVEKLAARVLEQEHKLYPDVIQSIATGRIMIEN